MTIYRIYLMASREQFKIEYDINDVIFDLDFLYIEKGIDNIMVIKTNELGDEVIISSKNDYLRIKGEKEDVSRGIERVYRKS